MRHLPVKVLARQEDIDDHRPFRCTLVIAGDQASIMIRPRGFRYQPLADDGVLCHLHLLRRPSMRVDVRHLTFSFPHLHSKIRPPKLQYQKSLLEIHLHAQQVEVLYRHASDENLQMLVVQPVNGAVVNFTP